MTLETLVIENRLDNTPFLILIGVIVLLTVSVSLIKVVKGLNISDDDSWEDIDESEDDDIPEWAK